MAPDFVYIDAILLAYRQGHLRHNEQREALISAARTSTDALAYITMVESLGVVRGTSLHQFLGHYLASPSYYRSLYPKILGIRHDGEAPETFLHSQQALFLAEPLLTPSQNHTFYDAFWWFVHNHEPRFVDLRRGPHIGVYATDPQDNASVVARFDDYLHRLREHSKQYVRQRYESMPVDLLMPLIRRTFL